MPQKPQDKQAQARRKEKNRRQAALHQAALTLAARHGWTDLTVAEVYTAAGVPIDKNAPATLWPLIADILSKIDMRVSENVHDRLGGTWRDDLFELLMTRFELMQEHREAYSDIMPAALIRPCQSGPVLTPRLTASMNDLINQARIPVAGVKRRLAIIILIGIYLSLLETWRSDQDADLSVTMAAVDRRLNWLEETLISRRSGRQTNGHA